MFFSKWVYRGIINVTNFTHEVGSVKFAINAWYGVEHATDEFGRRYDPLALPWSLDRTNSVWVDGVFGHSFPAVKVERSCRYPRLGREKGN